MQKAACNHEFWKARTLDSDATIYWELGTLRLWARRTCREWRLLPVQEPAEELAGACVADNKPPPETGTWRRWAFKDESPHIAIVPAMPDRPLVVRSDSPVRIPKGNEAAFFFSVPVVTRIYVGPERELLLHEAPTCILSKTWFGEPTGSGELCYSLKTRASRDLEGIRKGDHRVVCPLIIRNQSEEELNFEKLCIRAMHVNIHLGATRLWTEQIEVNYQGRTNCSEITFGKEAPHYERIDRMLGAAREPAPKSRLWRSFGIIKWKTPEEAILA